MKTLLLIVFIGTTISNARLIEKNTEKHAETEATESPAPVRVSRQAFYDDGIGFSKEDTQEDDLRPYVRKGRYSMKKKESNTKSTSGTRDSSEKAIAKHQTASDRSKTPFIKKPIPKFNEVDEEDFQGKVNKLPVKYADSGEHEDEDFNLDDYEFDVNHDEFVGRGKPLEPRVKIKDSKGGKSKRNRKPVIRAKPTLPPPEIKMQSKVVIPTEIQNTKKSTITKKAADKMKEDYYDDIVTTTKVPETETKRDLDDELSEDTDDSKEFHKNTARVARSPWFVKILGTRMGEKTASIMSKIMNALPIINMERGPYSYQEEAGLGMDPMTGRNVMF